ncbi:hypothetical protein [Streptomyces sp. NBC_01465]|uniref:hypothetical protein n=1 Tax=Streptomyces sp. NBC_01465 TaxID=2903878 RepID=UPI002E369D6D|nr:hypothetical protein [Streptomyces sp. NBC_01465]
MLGFGIGSIFPQLKEPGNYESWADEVERTLNLIPSIRKLEVKGGRSSFRWFDVEDADGRNDLIHHPIPVHGNVAFTINIPARAQDRLNPWWKASVDSEVEEFVVFLELDTAYPYALVVFYSDNMIKPSSAVVIVREFLKEELEKLGDRSTLELTTLGPSPFHAEFYIKEGDQGDFVTPGLNALVRHGRGYSECEFFFDKKVFESAAHVLDEVRKKIGPEFANFYGLTAERTVKQVSVDVLTLQVEEGVAAYRRKGAINWVRRVITSRANLRNISLELLKIQMGVTNSQRSNGKVIDNLRAERGLLLFEGKLVGMAELDYTDQLDNLGSMLKVLESQHTQTVQRITSFAVSLLGVVVGAFLTAALRK